MADLGVFCGGELSRANKLTKVCRVPLGVDGCSHRKWAPEQSRAEQRVVVASGLQVLFGPFEAGPRGGDSWGSIEQSPGKARNLRRMISRGIGLTKSS